MSSPWRRFKRWYRRPLRQRRYAQVELREPAPEALRSLKVGVLLPTFNRLPFLRFGLPSLLQATAGAEFEVDLLVWDNASQDGSAEFLSGIVDPRLRVHRSPENIGLNALAEGAAMLGGDFLLQVDDDVLWFPDHFLRDMIRTYLAIPGMGYLGAGVISDRFTSGGRLPQERSIRVEHRPGMVLDYGAVGGWCTLTDRALYEQVGGFTQRPSERYFFADRDYYRAVGALGRKRGIAASLQVYHAYGVAPDAKAQATFEGRIGEPDGAGWPAPPKVADDFWANFKARFGGAI